MLLTLSLVTVEAFIWMDDLDDRRSNSRIRSTEPTASKELEIEDSTHTFENETAWVEDDNWNVQDSYNMDSNSQLKFMDIVVNARSQYRHRSAVAQQIQNECEEYFRNDSFGYASKCYKDILISNAKTDDYAYACCA